MSEVSLGELRKLTIWPTVGSAMLLVWLSIVAVVNRYWVDGLTSTESASINVYVLLLIAGVLTWSLSRSIRAFKQLTVRSGSFAHRYLRACKAVAYSLLITLISALVMSGFIAFLASFGGSSDTLLDRVVLVYVPLILEASMIIYAVFVGLMSRKVAE